MAGPHINRCRNAAFGTSFSCIYTCSNMLQWHIWHCCFKNAMVRGFKWPSKLTFHHHLPDLWPFYSLWSTRLPGKCNLSPLKHLIPWIQPFSGLQKSMFCILLGRVYLSFSLVHSNFTHNLIFDINFLFKWPFSVSLWAIHSYYNFLIRYSFFSPICLSAITWCLPKRHPAHHDVSHHMT